MSTTTGGIVHLFPECLQISKGAVKSVYVEN